MIRCDRSLSCDSDRIRTSSECLRSVMSMKFAKVAGLPLCWMEDTLSMTHLVRPS